MLLEMILTCNSNIQLPSTMHHLKAKNKLFQFDSDLSFVSNYPRFRYDWPHILFVEGGWYMITFKTSHVVFYSA